MSQYAPRGRAGYLFEGFLTKWFVVVSSRWREAFAFVEGLDSLQSAAGATAGFQSSFARLGIEAFAFVALPDERDRYEDVVMAVHEPPELLKVFREKEYIQVSPALRHCRRTVRPFLWKDAPYDRERDPRAGEVIDLLADFNLSNAVMVPVPTPAGCAGGVWLAGRHAEFNTFCMPMLHIMALYAFERLKCLKRSKPRVRRPLTPREREVLTWVSLGKSAWEIGQVLCIAKRTVDEHMQTAMRKLGAVNRTQAVAIALRDRLIQP